MPVVNLVSSERPLIFFATKSWRTSDFARFITSIMNTGHFFFIYNELLYANV